MNLRDCPLLYVFLETRALADRRAFLESVVGLPVIEVDTSPGSRHGLVKYDAGTLLLSLNLSPARRFGVHASDGLAIVFAGGRTWHTDTDGHHYRIGEHRLSVSEVRLRVSDLASSVAFYRDVLGLQPLEVTAGTARLATRTVPIVLERQPLAVDGRPIRHNTYLLVFHTADINQMRASLTANGVNFSGRKLGLKEIGYTIRFTDPSGNRYCLYEPSEEVLTWSSGPRVREIVGDRSL